MNAGDLAVGLLSLLIIIFMLFVIFKIFEFFFMIVINLLKLFWEFVKWFFTRKFVVASILSVILNFLMLVFTGRHLLSLFNYSLQNELIFSILLSLIAFYIILPKDLKSALRRILQSLESKPLGEKTKQKVDYIYFKITNRLFETLEEDGIRNPNGIFLRWVICGNEMTLYEDDLREGIYKFSERLVESWEKGVDCIINDLSLYMEIYYDGNNVYKYTLEKVGELLYEADGLYGV